MEIQSNNRLFELLKVKTNGTMLLDSTKPVGWCCKNPNCNGWKMSPVNMMLLDCAISCFCSENENETISDQVMPIGSSTVEILNSVVSAVNLSLSTPKEESVVLNVVVPNPTIPKKTPLVLNVIKVPQPVPKVAPPRLNVIVSNPIIGSNGPVMINPVSVSLNADVKNMIMSSETYITFHERLVAEASTKQVPSAYKGMAMEIFAKLYFLSHKIHYNVKHYYSNNIGDRIPVEFNLQPRDMGTDAVIEHNDGKVSLIQVKFRTDFDASLSRTALSNMVMEAGWLREHGRLHQIYLFSNTYESPSTISDEEYVCNNLKYILFETIDQNWDVVRKYILQNEPVVPRFDLPELRAWQSEAIKWLFNGGYEFGRKQVIAACGAGKSILGGIIINYKHRNEYVYQNALIIVPNLHLLGQWFEVMIKYFPDRRYLLVGTDIHTGDSETTSYSLTRSPEFISEFLNSPAPFGNIVISTYQSLDKVMITRPLFDISICDEAHVTCSTKSSNFTIPTNEDFPIENVIYMSATPKTLKGKTEQRFTSMDDVSIYGERFTYSFKQAIDDGIISDYKIITGHGHISEDCNFSDIQFNSLFLYKACVDYGIKSILIFSNRHEESSVLYNETMRLFTSKGITNYDFVYMKRGATSNDKMDAIMKVQSGRQVLIFNVKMFSLGSDLPQLEAVMLNGDKTSKIDIVQSISRCLRKVPNKDYGKILIPCLIHGDDYTDTGNYMNLRRFLCIMGVSDESLVEEITLKHQHNFSNDTSVSKFLVKDVLNSVEIVHTPLSENNFDLKLFDRICTNGSIYSSQYQFNMLLEFIKDNNRIPLLPEIHKDVGVGNFFVSLIRGQAHLSNRERWFNELFLISEPIKKDIQFRLSQVGQRDQLALRKFELCKEFIVLNSILPKRETRFKDVSIGEFFRNLLKYNGPDSIKRGWIEELKTISAIHNLSAQIQKLITERGTHKQKKKQAYQLLCEYIRLNNQLPKTDEVYKDVKIGNVLRNLLRNQMKNSDQRMLEIRSLSPQIDAILTKRLDRKHEYVDLCIEYIIRNGRLPLNIKTYNGKRLGLFFNKLVNGHYKDRGVEWLELIKQISDPIKDEINALILLNNKDVENTKSLTPEQKFAITYEFISMNKRFPEKSDFYKGVTPYEFIIRILYGSYKSHRTKWIESLSAIDPNIRIDIDKRLEIINERKSKK
jgi:superfamily II DNA or RNA helicase